MVSPSPRPTWPTWPSSRQMPARDRSPTCGSGSRSAGRSDHPLRPGDVLGAEFLGEVVEVGPGVRRHRVGDRVVVGASVACGGCWYCRQGLHSCCDNAHADLAERRPRLGPPDAGCFGRPRAAGGFAGGHAEYVRVPYADVGAFPGAGRRRRRPGGVRRGRGADRLARRPSWVRCAPATWWRSGAPGRWAS